MANKHFSQTLAEFPATVHASKDRLVAIPSAVQVRIGLQRRADNHIVCYSVRKAGGGRWNHHYAKLTYDNEFAIPADVMAIRAGERVEVKLHRFIRDEDALAPPRSPEGTAGAALLGLAKLAIDGEPEASERIDEELYGE